MAQLKRLTHDDEQFRSELERLAELSAKAQNLKFPITNWEKFSTSSDRIYVMTVGGRLEGYLRIGTRDLWLNDPLNNVYKQFPSVISVLDFYVEHQRCGNGSRLFDFAIELENVFPHMIAYDRPSDKMKSFLARRDLILIEQSNKFFVSLKIFFPS